MLESGSGVGAARGAALFCLEPTQLGRSRSRPRDLGLTEPEPVPSKKVAAPQHWCHVSMYEYIPELKGGWRLADNVGGLFQCSGCFLFSLGSYHLVYNANVLRVYLFHS